MSGDDLTDNQKELLGSMDDRIALCEKFSQDHRILMTEDVLQEATAIYWTYRSRIEVVQLSPDTHEAQMLQLILLQILAQAEESLATFVIGSGKSATIIARTAMEAAISLIYILGKPKTRLVQYFLNSIEKEKAVLKKLRKLEEGEDNYLNNRANTLKIAEVWIKRMGETTGSKKINEKWPSNIFEVFEKSGYEIDYRTVYAKMSSDVHKSPIDFIIMLPVMMYSFESNQMDLFSQFIEGGIWEKRMAVYAGVFYCLEAASKYSTCFGFSDVTNGIFKGRDAIEQALYQMIVQARKATEKLRE